MTAQPRRGLRADLFLVEHGFAASRAEAQSAIAAGKVSADGLCLTKPSQRLAPGAQIGFAKAHPYVSRGALKLAAALDAFALSPRDRVCLDIGASTGGFTEVLLERGARHVHAIDVGHGQFHPTLAADPRVTLREGVNARDLGRGDVADDVEAIVADVSFISLKVALPAALGLARSGAWLVALVKPQFEAGRAALGKGGVVRDEETRLASVRSIVEWLGSQGWPPLGSIESPIAGGSGNREYLVAARKP